MHHLRGLHSCHSKPKRKTTISTRQENVTWVLKVRELLRVLWYVWKCWTRTYQDSASKLTCLRNSDLTRKGGSLLGFYTFLFYYYYHICYLILFFTWTNLFRKYMTCTSVSEFLPRRVYIIAVWSFYYWRDEASDLINRFQCVFYHVRSISTPIKPLTDGQRAFLFWLKTNLLNCIMYRLDKGQISLRFCGRF